MSKRATVTEAEMRRAIKAAKECGLTVHECIMTAAAIRIVFAPLDQSLKPDNTLKPKEWPR